MSAKFGEEFYDLDGVIVDSDGVIVESAIDNPLLFLAQRRHEAKTQEKAYEDYLRVIDRVLLKNQTDAKLAYGDTVIAVKGGRYATINGSMFADLVWEVVMSEDENVIERLLRIISAGTAFRAAQDEDNPVRPFLEPAIAEVLDKAKDWHEKRAWVESSVARRPAPKVRIVPNPEEEPVPA